jgi:four helix bundle protein
MNKNILKIRSFEFALKIVKLKQNLVETKKEYCLSKQLLKSGTSIGANIREAQNAVSKPDFINKLGISQKECDETIYWLELLYQSNYISKELFETLNQEAYELLKMIKSAILTTKNRLNS